MLAECAALIGDIQVRNRGTIGGSLAHADPAADYPAAALALEAEMTLESSSGSRAVKAADFFLELLTTVVKPGEILTRASFAPLAAGTGAVYLKHRHPASGFATVGVAAVVTLKGANFDQVRVGITGLGAKAFRASGVERALAGKGRGRDRRSRLAGGIRRRRERRYLRVRRIPRRTRSRVHEPRARAGVRPRESTASLAT